MRKIFAKLLYEEIKKNKNIILLTADLGYGLWDNIKKDFPENFFNVGSSEQLMLGMAVGLALEGKIPVVYSITPFLLYRPFEIIRNYLHYEKIPVKMVGGGRDKDYLTAGQSHWAQEDLQIMKVFDNIIIDRPENSDEILEMLNKFLYDEKPHYLNLKK